MKLIRVSLLLISLLWVHSPVSAQAPRPGGTSLTATAVPTSQPATAPSLSTSTPIPALTAPPLPVQTPIVQPSDFPVGEATPSPLEVNETGPEPAIPLVYKELVCAFAASRGYISSGLCELAYFSSYSSMSGGPVARATTDAVAEPIHVQPVASYPNPACSGQAAFDRAIALLNAVRFLVAESNKFPNDKFSRSWQYEARKRWHVLRQGIPARSRVINGNNGITPADWIAAGTEVLDHRDAFGQAWGNCAEQASTLAGLIYQAGCSLWVRVCYSGGHAWTEASENPQNTAEQVLILDPWGDSASLGARGTSCTHWYRKNAQGGQDQFNS